MALGGCGRKAKNPEEAEPLIALPPPGRLPAAGYQLILDYEVGGGRSYYERRLSRPTWPGAASGVTVGVGYDCGYNAPPVIIADWKVLPPGEVSRLAGTSGIRGAAAKARADELRDILIRWELAETVFERVTLTRFRQLAQRTYPGFDALRPNAQAALISLTFNRGSSMEGDRRREMRAIRDCAAKGDYEGMAHWNRESVRVWRGTAIEVGMIRRREAEARLMETP